MTYETAYMLINLGVLPAWLMLFFMPNSTVTKRLVHSGLYPCVYGALYGVLLMRAIFFGAGSEEASMTSLGGVTALFSHPNGVLIGWLHYLVFDLFIGAWIARDGERRGIEHWKLLPCMFFALMFGPVGLLLFMVLRALSSQGLRLEEHAAPKA